MQHVRTFTRSLWLGLLALLLLLLVAATASGHEGDDCGGCALGLEATPNEDGSVQVAFEPAEDSVSSRVLRSEGDGELRPVAVLDEGDGTYLDTDTEPGGLYTYTVVPVFEDGSTVEGCRKVEVTAVPVFVGIPGAPIAVLIALLAFVALRRSRA